MNKIASIVKKVIAVLLCIVVIVCLILGLCNIIPTNVALITIIFIRLLVPLFR